MLPESSSETEVSQETNETPDVNTENSSNSEGVEKPSYLDAVEAALKGGSEDSPASEEGEEQAEPEANAEGEAEGQEEGDPAELTAEELNALSVKTQKRVRHLVAQRDDVQRQNDALKPRAEQWDRVVSYLRDNRIQPAEFDNALEITGLINSGDYSRALQVLTPIYREVAARAGEILPQDLAEEVRLGRISEQHARELNRTRANARAATERESRTREERTAADEHRRVQEVVGSAVKAVDDWAKAKAGSDPDWSAKHKDVAEQVELELARLGPKGFPQTKEAAIEIAEKALKTVEDRIRRYRPKPKQTTAVTNQGASPAAKAKPKTWEEAMEQALAS